MSISYVLKNRANLIAIFLCVVSVALLGLISYNNQASYLHTSLQGLADNQSRLFQSIIKADIEGLARAHTGIDKLDQLLKPFASGKKDELLAAAQPLFNEIRQNNNITHMYFIKPDGTVFLRVHKPEESGDKLSRITYVKAAETKKIASGIEMGKNFFSLRSVKPVSYQGNPIGYMEVAEEIDHVFTRMKEVNGNDVSVFLTDDFLKTQVTHVQGEKIGNFRLLYPTNKGASLRLAAQLMPAMQSALKQPAVTIVSSPEGKIVVGMSPFIDASGNTVGILFSHNDVTPLFTAMWHGVVTNVLMLSAIVLTALVMLFISLKKLNMDLEQHAAALALSNSELKQAEIELLLREKSLANSERFLKTIIDTEPECIKMLDADCNLLMMNPAGLSMIDADSLEQVRGHCISPLVTPRYRDAFVALTKQVFQGIPGKLEFEAVGLKGRHVWLETHAVPFRNEHDEIVSLLGITRDITERKRAEEELELKNVILSTQQETSIDGILVVDENDTIISYNRRFSDLWEIPPELVESKDFAPVLELVAGRTADPESYTARVKYLYEHKEEKSLEEVFLKDGRVFDRYSAPMRGNDGKYYGRVWYLRDITERKRMEESLWKSESILRKIFVSIPDMLSVIDRDLRIVHSNWQGGYEYVPEDIRAGSPYCYDAYYPEQGKPCDDCHALKVFRTGKPVATEKYNPRIGFMEVRAFPIYDDSGDVVMVAEYIRNITEQKRLEEELRKAHKLESLGVLAGGIAHDFNNLLTGILGNISLAKIMTGADSKTFKRLDEAEKAVWRSRDLTKQLMTFSKGGAPVKKTASMEQIVKDSASFVLRGSNVRCDLAVSEHVWPVEVDEGQMNQVINNLIINADQSMVDGGIIEIGIENLTVAPENEMSLREGLYVKITIRDHGAGIPEEYLHKIFDPYFTTKQKGSGLGLASVYSIIKNHNGYVGVESKVGVGTTFQVYIPASENGLLEATEIKENPHAGSGRILVMDDEEIIREVAAEILRHLGYSVVVCSDGSEAIELYRQAIETKEPFAAVIMDLTIAGGMGGKEAAARILEIEPDAVLIVSSGYSSDPVLANFRQYGFSGVVPKPFDAEGLASELKRLIHNNC